MTYNKQGYASPPLKVTSTDNYQLVEVKGSYGSMPNGSSSSSSYVYCTLIQEKSQPDVWRCWPTVPLNTDADGYTDYSERPTNALTGWKA